jgi:hypothetical protein
VDEKPKKSSAYLIFSAQELKKIKKEHPDMQGRDMMKEVGSHWKSAPQEVKNKFEKLYQKQKGQSAPEGTAAKAKNGAAKAKNGQQQPAAKAKNGTKKEAVKAKDDDVGKNNKKLLKELHPGAASGLVIKRPRNPYLLFTLDARPIMQKNFPQMKPREVTAALAAAWKSASAATKEQYEVLSAVEKESYGKLKSKHITAD